MWHTPGRQEVGSPLDADSSAVAVERIPPDESLPGIARCLWRKSCWYPSPVREEQRRPSLPSRSQGIEGLRCSSRTALGYQPDLRDRKRTRLYSSHQITSYAAF